MKPYLVSLAAGLLVGVVYGLLGVRSPAPPVIALTGLFGILLGEQAVSLARRWSSGHLVTLASVREPGVPPVTGLSERSGPSASPPSGLG